MKILVLLFSLLVALQVTQAGVDCDGLCENSNRINLPSIDNSNLDEILIATKGGQNDERFEGIKGNDDRQTINNPRKDERIANYRVGKLEVTMKDNSEATCTATLVGRKFLLTAAHCFYDYSKGEFDAANAYFYLHASKDNHPVRGMRVSKVYLTKDIVDEEASMRLGIPKELIGKDFALLEITEELGSMINPNTDNKEGWNGFGNYENLNNDVPIKTAGYPGDKKGNLTFERCRANADQYADDRYKISCDVYPGQSGSSIVSKVERKGKIVDRVIGIVSAAGSTNYAVRFTDETFHVLADWYQGKDNPNTHTLYLGY